MKISGILWSKKAIGVALHKLKDIDIIDITVKGKDGKKLYPRKLKVVKRDLLQRYKVEIINKNNLEGIFIPIFDFPEFYN